MTTTMQLLERLADHARAGGARTAYREVGASGRAMSYAELGRAALAFAGALRGRVTAGAVVMLCVPNVVEYPVAFLGALAAGCDVFPVSADTAEAELVALAREAGVAAIVGTDRARAALSGEVGVSLGVADVLGNLAGSGELEMGLGRLLLCSSGTTGQPKIVVRDAASIDAVSENMCRGVGFTSEDRVLAIVPLSHSYGVEHGLLAPIWAGCGVHLCAGLDLGVVMAQLGGAGITLFPSVPSVYDMMCKVGEAKPLPTLRKAYAAGAPLPASVSEAFVAKFGVRIGQLYGLTEVGSVTFSDPGGPHFDPRAVGVPFDGVRVKIADPTTREALPAGEEGEVLIAAPSMFSGYLNETSASTVDGYFPTGDLGRVHEYDNLSITGRLKLLIEIGGRKVNVQEVEGVLAAHPEVGEAAVVAMRVSDTVSRLKAVVTPRVVGQSPDPEALRRYLRERLTAYKVPRVIEVRESLPRSAAGKVVRRLLEIP